MTQEMPRIDQGTTDTSGDDPGDVSRPDTVAGVVRRIAIPRGRSTPMASDHRARPGGVRLVAVLAGAVGTDHAAPRGPRPIALSRGEVLCFAADQTVGDLHNRADVTAVVADTVVDMESPGPVRGAGPDRPRGYRVLDSALTIAVLDVVSAATEECPDREYQRRAADYLASHLRLLLSDDGGVDLPGPHRDTAAIVPSPRSTTAAPTPAVFAAHQQRLLLEAMRVGLAEPVRIDDLAALVGYSRYHFLRRFRATFGTTPYQYLVAMRMRTARELLRRRPRPSLHGVARQCGFRYTESFIRAFHQHTGVTPARFADEPSPPGPA